MPCGTCVVVVTPSPFPLCLPDSPFLLSLSPSLPPSFAPQFYHPEFVARSDGREVTRVQASGMVKVSINVMTRGMSAFGYSTGGPPDGAAQRAPVAAPSRTLKRMR